LNLEVQAQSIKCTATR